MNFLYQIINVVYKKSKSVLLDDNARILAHFRIPALT